MIDVKQIESPSFLKELTISELEQLSRSIRDYIIDNVAQTGGHLSSSLGAVDLIIALHYVFDSPHDKLLFDVGHQAYAHKILTGRAKDFPTLRQHNGISGFLKYSESEHDVWEAGHSSTAISAASGFLEAKKRGKDIGEVIAIVGDGSIQNGLSLAGLNILGNNHSQKAIIILNDNEMSISKNVGALATLFNKIRIKKSFRLLRRITPNWLMGTIRNVIYHNNFFSDFGLKYIGPIDGHDIKSLIKYLKFCKETDRSIVLHIKTTKGKGYQYSEKDTIGKWHGVTPFDRISGQSINTPLPSYSEYAGELLYEKAKINPLICIISPAMIYNSGFHIFQEKLPSQIIDVGIAEENAVVIASAMSRNEFIPIIPIYSTFLARSYDEINHDVARTNAHVVFLVDRAGIVGEDGDTHQGIFDVAFLSHLPNFVIANPSNKNEFTQLLDYAIIKEAPFVIRYPKGACHVDSDKTEIEYGKWRTMLPFTNVNVLTYGPNVNEFYHHLKSEDEIGLINAIFIKPLDEEMLNSLNNTTLYIYEEAICDGSLGSLITRYVSLHQLNIKIYHYAINDYVSHGKINEIKDIINLNIEKIIDEIKRS